MKEGHKKTSPKGGVGQQTIKQNKQVYRCYLPDDVIIQETTKKKRASPRSNSGSVRHNMRQRSLR
jgi:hypothetical protein